VPETEVPSVNRYDLRGELGRGGTGIVYEAFDARTESLVALKTIGAAGPEHLYRLKREFRALADVQHPNLVRLGELSSEEGQWYFTMELVRGTNFIDYVRPPSDDGAGVRNVLDEGRLRAVLPQLVSALNAIHDAGHLHRDVKPSNVLISRDGRLVLLDFGLVTALRSAQGAGDDDFVGTPTYMAPEQIEGKGVGPAADWYAMGVMLFLALTGRLPFEGTFDEILEAKLLADQVPSSHRLSPGAPQDLGALCSGLLQLEPSRRPSVAEIRTRLGMRADEASSGGIRSSEAVFVGRVLELGALDRALAEVERGQPRMVIVEGEPGVGKSAVVNRFLSSVGARAIVLQGRCYEQESVPFKGIDTILDALSEHLLALSAADTRRAIAGGVNYLAALFPVLKRVPVVGNATAGDRFVGNASAMREQAFGEFERLLRALARRHPVVLFVDDLQWADRDSLALLRRALVDGAACLLVATMRPDAPPEAVSFTQDAERIALGGLSPDESRLLWTALSPKTAHARVTEEQRNLAMREAAGHPMFLAELARSAHDHELNLHAGTRLLDVLWDRVRERDEVDRRLLEVVAVAGGPTPDAVLAQAADVPLGEVQTRLGPLRAAQLVRVGRREDERVVEPYHDRLRESIVLRLEREARGRLEMAIGRALLEGARGELLSARIFAIVQHLNAAPAARRDDPERIRLAELNLLAAKQARLSTAYDRALEYVRIGLDLVGTEGWSRAYELTRDLHVERMQAEFLGGNADAAQACFDGARAHLRSAEDRTNLHASWIELLTGEGRYRDAIDVGRMALDALQAPVPVRVGTAGVLIRYLATRLVQKNRAVDALLHLPLLKDPRLQGVMRLLMALAPAAFFSDTKLLTWILLRIAGLSMRFGVTNVSSYGFGGYGLVLSAAFGKREAGAAFARFALDLNERFENLALTSKLQMIAGMLVPWVRPFADAKAHLRDGYEVALKIGDTTYECYCAVVLSIVSFCESNDLAAVQADAEWARDVSVRRKERAMIGVPESHARHAATLRGLTPNLLDLGTAESPDAEFRASLSDSATPTALFYYQLCTADLAYHFGSVREARTILREAEKRTEGIFGLPTTVELHFLDALVAAREHDLAGTPWLARLGLRLRVHGALRKLKAWARSCPANFEAHALIVEAELARIRGQGARADECFERATSAARTHGSARREALALELSAAHARAAGDTAKAGQRTTEATSAYERWGALAKVEALQRAT
jgi:predicted ATPase